MANDVKDICPVAQGQYSGRKLLVKMTTFLYLDVICN